MKGGAVHSGCVHLSECIICFSKKYNSWFFEKKINNLETSDKNKKDVSKHNS